jgi:prephenate dehydrogenase
LKVAVLGTGLMGGSLGLAIRQRVPGWTVQAYDPDRAVRERATDLGVAHGVSESPEEAASGADLVVLAPPVDLIPAVCARVAPVLGASAVVTDVGSAKVEVVRAGEGALGDRFVGGHPMAGSERHGVDASDAGLFEGAWWILTPTEATSSRSYSMVTDMIGRVGGKPVAVAPAAHDALVARLSHLPQLTASALVEVASSAGDREALLGLAGAGFRDVTRIAASNPALWVAIVRSNRQAVLEGLERLRDRLGSVAEMIGADRWTELQEFLARSRDARLELFAKPEFGGEPIELAMMVPDRPGVLAEVTTAAGNLGANIEDLRIVHSTEGGRGRLELVVAGREAAAGMMAALESLGYRVDVGSVE